MDQVNFQSLNMVRDELVATIEESARSLEHFVSSQDDSKSLQACIEGVTQIHGILRLIQLQGAELLAKELLATATEISPGNSGPKFERRLETVSGTFFVLTRYLEYIQQTERKVPVLLVPQINELRKLRGESAYPESHFFSLDLSNKPAVPSIDMLNVAPAEFKQTVRRLRHMYQVGLLGLMREKQVNNCVAMMRRSMTRLRKCTPEGKPMGLLWWLASVALEVFVSREMQLIETRKMLFGRIDRIIRQVETGGDAALSSEPPKGLVKELVYLIALSASDSEEAKVIRAAYKAEKFPYTDTELSKERDHLSGPSAHTVSSLANVLQTEISNIKKILESASQSSSQMIDDLDEFIGTLQKISEILAIVGLVAASNILKKEIVRIDKWREHTNGIDTDEMQEVANTMLYLESTVSSLANSTLSDAKLAEANEVAQREVIASGALSEAKRIVMAESEAGISLTKRALSSFADSGFDVGHIRNIGKTLATVRGGMLMLKNQRAANVLEKCAAFVDEVLLDKDPAPAMKEMLETFADAVISMEYYLNSASANLRMDDSVLQVAEESLEALGYKVEPV